MKDEWLQRGSNSRRRSGWLGDYYIPSVDEGPVNHPIAEVYLTVALPHPDLPQGPNNLPASRDPHHPVGHGPAGT